MLICVCQHIQNLDELWTCVSFRQYFFAFHLFSTPPLRGSSEVYHFLFVSFLNAPMPQVCPPPAMCWLHQLYCRTVTIGKVLPDEMASGPDGGSIVTTWRVSRRQYSTQSLNLPVSLQTEYFGCKFGANQGHFAASSGSTIVGWQLFRQVSWASDWQWASITGFWRCAAIEELMKWHVLFAKKKNHTKSAFRPWHRNEGQDRCADLFLNKQLTLTNWAWAMGCTPMLAKRHGAGKKPCVNNVTLKSTSLLPKVVYPHHPQGFRDSLSTPVSTDPNHN